MFPPRWTRKLHAYIPSYIHSFITKILRSSFLYYICSGAASCFRGMPILTHMFPSFEHQHGENCNSSTPIRSRRSTSSLFRLPVHAVAVAILVQRPAAYKHRRHFLGTKASRLARTHARQYHHYASLTNAFQCLRVRLPQHGGEGQEADQKRT